jgi:hypothetical protein
MGSVGRSRWQRIFGVGYNVVLIFWGALSVIARGLQTPVSADSIQWFFVGAMLIGFAGFRLSRTDWSRVLRG